MKILYLFLALLFISAWRVETVQAQACTHYAAPTGSGSNNGLSQSTPFRITDFWGVGGFGSTPRTLCLLNGTYQGDSSMIDVPGGINGTVSNPITIKCLNEVVDSAKGSTPCNIDGQGARIPIRLEGPNDYFILEGFDAYKGNKWVLLTRRGSGASPVRNLIVRRVVAWDAAVDPEPGILSSNYAIDSLFEDVATFGQGRNHYDFFAGTGQTARRTWAYWESGGGLGSPEHPYVLGYQGGPGLIENSVATWNTTGNSYDPYGLWSIAPGGTGPHRLLGSIGYIKSSDNFAGSALAMTGIGSSFPGQDFTIMDLALFNGKPAQRSFTLESGSPACANCTLTNVTEVGGNPSGDIIESAWKVTNRVTSATAPVSPGSSNIWNGTSGSGAAGRLCYRYVNGTLTKIPLWPWPMDGRIRSALSKSGRDPDTIFGGLNNGVTQQMEALFGIIPPACRSGAPGVASITITTPAGSHVIATTDSTVVTGTANCDSGTPSVAWKNDRGGSGTATGTTSWSATVPLTNNRVNGLVFTATCI